MLSYLTEEKEEKKRKKTIGNKNVREVLPNSDSRILKE